MDIWGWVHNTSRQLRSEGQGALAGQINRLADVANRGPLEQVDAVVPGLVAAARAIDSPWLEVFARHWHLQNRLLRRRQGVAALGEAVSLYEFAHRDETKDCPQSICVTQDLMICYATVDGPGYVDERLEVAEETLGRIDPTWGCFECLTIEKVRALLDDQRPQDALEFITTQMGLLQGAGEPPNAYLLMFEARALNSCGRPDEALERIQKSKVARGDMGGERGIQLRMTEAEVHLARSDVQALHEALPDFEDVLQNLSIGTRWSRMRRRLIDSGHHDDIQTAMSQSFTLSTRFQYSGAHRDFLHTSLDAGWLAVSAAARSTARRALERADTARSRLTRDRGASELVEEFSRQVESMTPRLLPLPVGELAPWIKSGGRRSPDGVPSQNPELPAGVLDIVDVLEWCDAGLEEDPDNRELTEVMVTALLQSGDSRSARIMLETALQRASDDETLLGLLCAAVLQDNDAEAVASLDRRLRLNDPDQATWLMARWYAKRNEWTACLDEVETLLVAKPEGRNARRLAVRAATELGDFETATRHADILCQLPEPPPSDHWLRIEVASASQSWASVRAAAASLELPIDPVDDPETPVEQAWGPVAIEISDQFTGMRSRWAARRTGPTTARIVAVDPSGGPQRHGDLVAFRATPIEPLPEDPEERKRAVLAFPYLSTISPGGFRSFRVEGIHPGAEIWESFRTALGESGRDIWISYLSPVGNAQITKRTGLKSERRAAADVSGDGVTARRYFVAWFATETTSDLSEESRILTELTAHWPDRPAWADLAQASGLDAEVHKDRAEELQSMLG